MRLYSFLIILVSLTHLTAQTPELDSLKEALLTVEGIDRVPVLIAISDKSYFSDTEYARKQAKEALYLSKTARDTLSVINSYNLIGITFDIEGRKDSSKHYFTQFYQESKRTGHIDRMAAALNNLGMWNWSSGNFEEALSFYFRAASISDSLQERITLSKAYNNIGLIYQELNDYKKAKDYNQKAFRLRKELGFERGLIHSYNNLGICAQHLSQYDSSRYFYEQGLAIAKRTNDRRSQADINQNLGVLEELEGNHIQAINRIKQSLEYEASPLSNIFSLNTLSGIYYELNQSTKSVEFAEKALELSQQMNSYGHQEDVYMNLTRAHTLDGSPEKAVGYLMLWDEVKDSIFSNQSAEKYNNLEIKYETERKEQLIAIQESEIAQQKAQNQLNIVIIAGLILIVFSLAILVLLVRSRSRKQQALVVQQAKTELREAQIEASISSQEKERSRFAKDLHDGFGQMISILNLNLKSLENNPETKHEVFEESAKVLEEMYQELKGICFNLMPQTLINNGISPALNEFTARINTTGKIVATTDFFGLEERLDELQEISLYRISQEWVNNILRYSDASKVNIQITRDVEELTLLIEDNGAGFDTKEMVAGKGNGWKNMNSRANLIQGELELDTRLGIKGNTLIVNAPTVLKSQQQQKRLPKNRL